MNNLNFKFLTVGLSLLGAQQGFSQVVLDNFTDATNPTVGTRTAINSPLSHNGTDNTLDYSGTISRHLTYNFTTNPGPNLDFTAGDRNTFLMNLVETAPNSGIYSNNTFDARITLFSGVGPSLETGYIDANITPASGLISFPFDDFHTIGAGANASLALADIQSMRIDFNTGGVDNGDAMSPGDLAFRVSSIEAVPEPCSMLALGGGLAAFAKRRRSEKLAKLQA